MPGADNDARRAGDKRSGTPSRTSRPSRSGSREHTGGELIADRYRLQDRLGVGGMGEVWSGRDLRLHRDVAVKLFHGGNGMSASDLPGWLRREGIAAAQIVHPNVAVIYDQGAHRDRIYLVLELVPGTTLAELMQAGRLPVPDALSYAAQVAEALSAAHTARVVHRDIKPQNVLVTPDGTVKVVDFGIAGFLADTRSWTIARFDDAVKGAGTPEYSAPEQILGHNADARSDLYSLGTLLYTMLAGQLPYRADDFLAVMHKKTTEDAPLVPAGAGAPRDVIALVAELLSREPEERPGSARKVAARLRALLERSRPGTEEVVAAGERPVGERPVAVETGPALDEPWTAPPLEVEPPKPVAKLKAQVAPMAQVSDDDESSKLTDRRTEKPASPAAKPFPWGGGQRLDAVGGEDDRAQGEQASASAAQPESRSELSAGTDQPPASVGEPKSASAERRPQTENPSNPSAGTNLPSTSAGEPKSASAERRPQAESPSNASAGTDQPPASAGEPKPASAERRPQAESPSNASAGTDQPPASAGEPKPANAERRPQAEIPSQPSAKSDRPQGDQPAATPSGPPESKPARPPAAKAPSPKSAPPRPAAKKAAPAKKAPAKPRPPAWGASKEHVTPPESSAWEPLAETGATVLSAVAEVELRGRSLLPPPARSLLANPSGERYVPSAAAVAAAAQNPASAPALPEPSSRGVVPVLLIVLAVVVVAVGAIILTGR